MQTLVSIIPSMVSDTIVYFPCNDQLGQVMKELCRITLRLHSLGVVMIEVNIIRSIDV